MDREMFDMGKEHKNFYRLVGTTWKDNETIQATSELWCCAWESTVHDQRLIDNANCFK
jgi:hypothetical protein